MIPKNKANDIVTSQCFQLLLLFALTFRLPSAAAADFALTIDPAKTGAEFEGVGAVSAGASSRLLMDYPEPMRSQILDWLFLPKYGAGFQHLKVEVGGEINSTDGTEPTHARSREELDHPKREYFERGYEWWLMQEAKKRNPNIILDCLAWGAPGWIGDGQYCSQDMADYLVGFIKGQKYFHDLDIGLVGCWNEKEVTPEWIKLLRRTLDANGLRGVKVVGGDLNGPPEQSWKIAVQATEDPALAKCLYAIGVHYPYGIQPASVNQLRAQGIHTWASEFGEWDWNTMQPYLYRRAANMNNAFIEQGFTKINFWSPVTSYYDCLPAPRSGVLTANTPWSGAFHIEPTLWAVAHITQFAEPGWRFMDGVGRRLPQGGSVLGLVARDGKNFSAVIETTGADGEQTITLKFSGASASAKVHLWRTDQMEQFIELPDLPATNGVWKLQLTPNCIYTVTTTAGQCKGIAACPPPSGFPLPYQDDFERYQPHATPRWFSDQGGTFEVVARAGGGQCLRQQLQRPGIDWSGGSYAYTVIGDDHWSDIEVSAEASLETLPAAATVRSGRFLGVVARWNPGATWTQFRLLNPAGYQFKLYADGHWQLTTARQILGDGKMNALNASGWQTLTLRCVADQIEALVNGRSVVQVRDATYQNGLVGISSGFHTALFDHFLVRQP